MTGETASASTRTISFIVDGSLCTGHGRCYSLAPDVFAVDDEGFPAVRDAEVPVPAGAEPAARLACDSCPEGAIRIVD